MLFDDISVAVKYHTYKCSMVSDFHSNGLVQEFHPLPNICIRIFFLIIKYLPYSVNERDFLFGNPQKKYQKCKILATAAKKLPILFEFLMFSCRSSVRFYRIFFDFPLRLCYIKS